jgi:hypothetical protein
MTAESNSILSRRVFGVGRNGKNVPATVIFLTNLCFKDHALAYFKNRIAA